MTGHPGAACAPCPPREEGRLSQARVDHCIEQARGWQEALLVHAVQLERRVALGTVGAGALVAAAAVCGIVAVVVSLAGPEAVRGAVFWLWTGVAVALPLAAVSFLLPLVLGYSGVVKDSRCLADRYRAVLGLLLDVQGSRADGRHEEWAQCVVDCFDEVDRDRTCTAGIPARPVRRRPTPR